MSCSCGVGPIVVPPTHVFPPYDHTEPQGVPLTAPFSSADVKRVLTTLRIECLTANTSLRLAIEGSDDASTWEAGDVVYGTWRTADTAAVDETLGSLASKLFYRLSVQLKSTASPSRVESVVISVLATPSSVA